MKCPTCGEEITIDEQMLDEGYTVCPNCGEELEFDLEQDEDEFDWDMYHIGEAVDAVQQVMLDHGFDIHRPYIEDDGKHRTVHDYERAGGR